MDKLCDLHTHSTYSDGTLSPAQLIAQAEQVGLSAIALTDHNTIGGLPDFLAAGEKSSVEAIAGIEFSTDYEELELHIVALFIQPQHYHTITKLTDEMNVRKRQSNIDLIEKLNRAGYAINYDTIKASMPGGEPNRALIAAELTRLGYTASNQEAFKTLLGKKCGYYIPPKRIDTFELITFLRSIGAVPILAHPFLNLKEPEALRKFLGPAKENGLIGLETHYSKFTPEQTQLCGHIAREFNLLPSGGSDFHGANKPDIMLGAGTGNLRIPLSFLDNFKQMLPV